MKVRVKFCKHGEMKFIGHLDIMRYFQKAIRRSGIPICYSTGFSPHQVMSFAAPLGVGLTSNGEYMDIEVKESKSSAEMVRQLSGEMVSGIKIVSFRALPDNGKNAMSIVAAADYTLSFREGYEPEDIDGFFRDLLEFYQQDGIMIIKKTKKSEKETDIKPLIYQLEIRNQRIFLKIAAGSSANLKPQLFMEAFYQHRGIPLKPFTFQIQREELYADSGEDGQRRFISLEDLGEEIEG